MNCTGARLPQGTIGLVVLLFFGSSRLNGETPPIFDVPMILAQHQTKVQEARAALVQGDFAAAERLANEALQRVPFDDVPLLQRLRAQARQGKRDAALDSLEILLKRAPRDTSLLRNNPDLSSLRDDPRFKRLLEQPPAVDTSLVAPWSWQAKAAVRKDRDVLISSANTTWQGQMGMFVSLVDLGLPEAGVESVVGQDAVGALIRGWQLEGTAAGHQGDMYDNFDDDHSLLNLVRFPQLTRTRYDAEVRRRDLHRGLQTRFLFAHVDPQAPDRARTAIVIGNSSIASLDPVYWRSLPRLACVDPAAMQRLHAQYLTNHLYIYPEHRDHDAGHNGSAGGGFGDVYPANSPYLLISQGSSGSDQPLLDAIACTLAALRPDVKQTLANRQFLMPTMQMIFRRSYALVTSDQEYLSGLAHPSVFEGSLVNAAAMVNLAHKIERGSEPPLAQLEVVSEDEAVAGRDCFFGGKLPGQRLFDTPEAIARVFRTTRSERKMVISAQKSADLNGLPLTYHWVVLRGDPSKVTIKRLDPRGSAAELTVAYHARRPIRPGVSLESNRVDVGVFVHNGKWYSAPAFVTHFFLDNERRTYDAQGRIEEIEYSDSNYVDPLIDSPKRWRDHYHYDAAGNCTGWTRRRTGPAAGKADEFNAEGQLIESADAGVPSRAVDVEYFVVQEHGRTYVDYRQAGSSSRR